MRDTAERCHENREGELHTCHKDRMETLMTMKFQLFSKSENLAV